MSRLLLRPWEHLREVTPKLLRSATLRVELGRSRLPQGPITQDWQSCLRWRAGRSPDSDMRFLADGGERWDFS